MEPDRLDDLERRVAALETELEAWRIRTRQLIERRYGGRSTRARPSRFGTATRSSWQSVVDVVTGEGAIGRIGIGLLLLGLVYAVQYGIDRGWITEVVQVVLAAVLGFLLLGLGHRLKVRRPILSRLLTGGGFGALYVAVYAAQAVYGLIPFGIALAAATAVTAGCFLVGTSRDDAAMAVVAVLGGLSTPFIIRSGDPDLPGLVIYASIVLAAAGLLYWRHGWRLLLGWTALAALPVMVLILVYLHEPDAPALAWRWAAQGGILVGVLIFTVLPLARSSVSGLRPAPEPPVWIRADAVHLVVPTIAAVVALAAWGMERAVWDLQDTTWAAIGAVLVGMFALAYRAVDDEGMRLRSASILLAGSWVAAIVFVDLFDGGGLSMAGWSLVVGGLIFGAARRDLVGARFAAATLTVVLVFWLPERLGEAVQDHTPFMTWDALGDVLSLILLGAAARELAGRQIRLVAGLALWAAVLGLTAREFPEAGAVTASWSVFAVALLAAGRFGSAYRLVGMLTVAVVVAKLLLFDLSRMDGLVRVGLFVGFGAALLVVSYFFPTWWRGTDRDGPGDRTPDDQAAAARSER